MFKKYYLRNGTKKSGTNDNFRNKLLKLMSSPRRNTGQIAGERRKITKALLSQKII